MLVFEAQGALGSSTQPGGTISGWTEISTPSGSPTYGIWVKCAAASGEGTTASLLLSSSTNTPSKTILVDLANANGCPGSVTATVPNPLPSVAATTGPWTSSANKTLSGNTISSATAGTYVLQAWDFNGLDGTYYPSAVMYPPFYFSNGNSVGNTTGESVEGVGPTTVDYSNIVYAQATYPTTTSNAAASYFGSELGYSVWPASKNILNETLSVLPGPSIVPATPYPSPIPVVAIPANTLLYNEGVNTHFSYQDSGGGAFYYYATTPAPNGNTLISGATGTGRNIMADMVFRHLRDGLGSESVSTICGWYQNTLVPLGYDIESGTVDYSTIASLTTLYNCVTDNGTTPLAMRGFEGLNEYNASGDGSYEHGGNTGSTAAPHPNATVGTFVGTLPLASPSPAAASCGSSTNATPNPTTGGTPCTSSNWAAYVFANQQAMSSARSVSYGPTASPFPHSVKLISSPVIFASDNLDFNTLANYYTSQGVQPGTYTDLCNLHGYTFAGVGNPDVTVVPGESGLAQTMATTQIICGSSPVQPVVVSEEGAYDANGTYGNQPAYIDFPTKSKYTMRAMLQGESDGADGVYIYDLAMENNSDFYALLDGYLNPTPAYTSMRAFSQILNDPGDTFPSTATLPHASLSYYIDGTSDVKSLLLEKADGSFWLVVWKNDGGFEQSSPLAPIAVPTTTPTIRFNQANASYTTWAINPLTGAVTTTPLTAYTGLASVVVPVWDMPIILQIGNVTGSTPNPATPQPVVCPTGYTPNPNPTGAPLCEGNPFP
jgi:hypothetical protein